jgi:ABC-type cobalt transport system substrate-binding protein
MTGRNLAWLALALAVPTLFWVIAPAGVDWAGTDDRMGELANPAGVPIFPAPEWTPETEQFLFLAQAGVGAAILAGSLWIMKSRRGQGS